MSQPRLFLLDGHAQLYKAYHAVAPLTNSRGEPTGAIYGFMQTFHRIRREYQPDHLAVVFDPPGKSFRADVLPSYKANRPPQPPELTAQFNVLKDLLAAMQVPVFEVPPFEADDVLATLASWAVAHGGEAMVVSVDKDLLQVVRPGIRVLREHLGKIDILDEAGVREKMGVSPRQVPDFLGLLGDTSDNIPGVPGIGKKRAADLLAEFPDLETLIVEAQGRTKPKFWVSLAESADAARLSRQLATVRHDVPLEANWDALAWSYRDSPALRDVLERLEFRSYLEELGGPKPVAAPRVVDYAIVRTLDELDRVLADVRASGRAALDTETTGLDPHRDDLLGISLSSQPHQGAYIPLAGPQAPEGLALEVVRARLAPLLADPAIEWIAHNWRFDYKVLAVTGFAPGDIAFDTMIAAYLLDPERESKGLKGLGSEILGIRMTEYAEIAGGTDDLVTLATVDVQKVGEYACADADVTRQLADYFAPRLDAAELRPLFGDIEMPLASVLARMELEGVRLDRAWFAELSREVAARLTQLRDQIHMLAGRPFNINSPKQLAQILFEEKGFAGTKKTTTGFSTDVTVLEGLAATGDPLPVALLEYRQLEKLRGTYIDALPGMVNARTGRIHTSFNQTVAATGRLSSSDPNLQNIPVRTDEGRKIRRGFIARDAGWTLLAADYSQIELRILAHMSGDPALVHAFATGKDIHTLTASKVFRVEPADVTSQMRGAAKAINFGIIYGMTAFRLGRDLDIPPGRAQEFIDEYFRVYEGVRRFIDSTLEDCRRTGFVRTLMGRRRAIPDIHSTNHNTRQAAERVAVNTPIQGTSADMIKLAMIRIDRRIRREGLAARMILQVHDELIFDAPDHELDALRPLVVEEMRNALPLSVPIQIDVSTGPTWADL
ncbi:MAG: DNA polymerase I [Candidatus Sumerlaeia bacterium]|nr:DNA polymerase I [Candidatus Sumerlaeia bacterium]